MPPPDFFLHFVIPLNQINARYMVTGSIAAMFYGEMRLTTDVDFVVFLNELDVARLNEAFPASDFYIPPSETIFAEIRREQRGCFNIIHSETGLKADIYLVGRDELNAWGFRSKRAIEYHGHAVTLAPPEYVIIRKLEYYREGRSEKHLRDIRSMLAVSGDQFDQAALKEWIQKRGLAAEWRLASEESAV